jgi:hypothetical protein
MRIWNKEVDFDLLLQVKPDHYHVFPGARKSEDDGFAFVTQEESMHGMQAGGLLYVSHWFQKDGSRFKVLRGRKIDGVELAQRLGVNLPGRRRIIAEKNISAWGRRKDALGEIVKAVEQGRMEEGDWIYRAYRVHDFLNASRYIPVLIVPEREIVINLTHLWSEELGPEDDLGLLVKPEKLAETLSLAGHEPEEWDYLAMIRLCRCCGIVSDMQKPRVNPWLKKKNLIHRRSR